VTPQCYARAAVPGSHERQGIETPRGTVVPRHIHRKSSRDGMTIKALRLNGAERNDFLGVRNTEEVSAGIA
jgi:hypothetical protein